MPVCKTSLENPCAEGAAVFWGLFFVLCAEGAELFCGLFGLCAEGAKLFARFSGSFLKNGEGFDKLRPRSPGGHFPGAISTLGTGGLIDSPTDDLSLACSEIRAFGTRL